MMAGLALAVPILGGLLLDAARVPLHRPGRLGLLAGVTLAGDIVLFLRRRALAERHPSAGRRGTYRAGTRYSSRCRCPDRSLRGGRLAGPARPTSHSPVSPSSCCPRSSRTSTHEPRVSNDQGGTTSYRLVLLRDGQVSATWNLRLANGRTWQAPGAVHGHLLPTCTGYPTLLTPTGTSRPAIPRPPDHDRRAGRGRRPPADGRPAQSVAHRRWAAAMGAWHWRTANLLSNAGSLVMSTGVASLFGLLNCCLPATRLFSQRAVGYGLKRRCRP